MNVITISREYGACGHTVGRQVAERLGIEFYDRDIILRTAEESGLDIEEIKAEEETLSKTESFLRAIRPAGFDVKDTIFEYERRAIIELAKKGPCVILGRCASVLLDEVGIENTSVFLHASVEARMPHVAELIGTDDPDTVKRAMRKIDTGRTAYYHYYTGRDWSDVNEHDLAINTGVLGYERTVELICSAVQ